MKQKHLITILLLISLQSFCQELSYGIILGTNISGVWSTSGLNQFSDSKQIINPTMGGYIEYNFNNNLGIKTGLTLTKKQTEKQTGYYSSLENFKLNYLEISPNLKYDFGNEYRKGFYMLLGPKIAFLTKAKNSNGIDSKEIFENSTTGLQLGFGQRIFQIIDIETKLDYEFQPFSKSNNVNNQFIGAYLTLNLDIETLVNKK
ncbi:porin family protein [Flavobacterium sp. W1B]|uniref:porin family protein n=1 Tax=Flavobacterium sp. W1B TaxID=3394146 RepID=UPI0039BC4A92